MITIGTEILVFFLTSSILSTSSGFIFDPDFRKNSFPTGVTSECIALLGRKLGFGGVSDSGFSSCTAPTYYCGSKYFYNQHPQVQNLIKTERSLKRSEHRVKSKAS